MFAVVITEKGGAQRRMEFDESEVTIGRVQGNDIILPKGNVSKRHSRIVLKDNRFIVVDLKSTNGTYVNGRKITSPLVVKPGDKVYIGDFILTVEDLGGAAAAAAPSGGYPPQPPASAPTPPPAQPQPPPSQPQRSGPPPLRPRTRSQPPAPTVPPEPEAPPPAAPPQRAAAPQAPPQNFEAEREPAPPPKRQPPPARRESARPPARRQQMSKPPPAAAPVGELSSLAAVMRTLGGSFDLAPVSYEAQTDKARWDGAKRAVDQAVQQLIKDRVLDEKDPALASAAVQEAVGLGALDSFLQDQAVTEIVVQGATRVLVDRGAGLMPTDAVFSSPAMLTRVARRLVARSTASESDDAIIHASLSDGSHMTVILPPVAVGGPIIEVRRQASQQSNANELVQLGFLDESMLELLQRAVAARRNIAVVGPAGAGVTTVLGALASLVDEDERIVAVADVPDVGGGDRVVALSTGGPTSGVRLAELARQATHLRCDRLIVDGVSGLDALGVLGAIAARGYGSFMGVHGPTSEDPTATIRLLAKLGGGTEEALAQLIAQTAQVVVQVDRTELGHRVVAISEVSGSNGASIVGEDLYRFNGNGFEATGARPSF